MSDRAFKRMRQCPLCGELNELDRATCKRHGCHANLVINGILVDVDEKGNIYPVNMENNNDPFDIVIDSAEDKVVSKETEKTKKEKMIQRVDEPKKVEMPQKVKTKQPNIPKEEIPQDKTVPENKEPVMYQPTAKDLKRAAKEQKKIEKQQKKAKKSKGKRVLVKIVSFLVFFGLGFGGYFIAQEWSGSDDRRATVKEEDTDDKREDNKDEEEDEDIEETNQIETWMDANGTTFTGQRVNGKLEGKGTAIYESGDTYDGYFVASVRQGEGIYEWNSGDRYVGNWENGEKDGYGVYWWPDGDRYAGEWEADQRTGIGTYYYADGTVEYGRWENGELVEEMTQ